MHIKLDLTTRYITEDTKLIEDIHEIISPPNCKIAIIQAPQGSGKSYLIDTFPNKAIITPTRVLREQQAQLFNLETVIGTKKNARNILSINQISTMASSGKLGLDELEYIIFDECHKLVDYSTFAGDSVKSTLETIKYCYDNNIKVVLVSATPQNLIFALNLIAQTLNDSSIANYHIEITPKDKQKYINTLYVYGDSITFYTRIKSEITKRVKNGKQIALLKRKKQVYRLTDYFNSANITATGFTSDNTQSGNEDFSELIHTGNINKQVLCSTSLIDCGININNSDIADIYCGFNSDITMLLQLMARARNTMPNFHIQMAKLTERESATLDKYSDNLRLYEALKWHAEQTLKNATDEKELANTNGLVKVDGNYIFSNYALIKYIISLRNKQTLSTQEGIKQAFCGVYDNVEFLGNDTAYFKRKEREQFCGVKPQRKRTFEKNAPKIKEYLNSLVGVKLNKTKRDEIIMKLQEMGVEGKQFKAMIKNLNMNFSVKSLENKRDSIIEKC